jgi:hypothetical protein
MRVSYGPPGHKGVTHLLAVGDTDPQTTSLENYGSAAGIGIAVIGGLVHSKRVFYFGAGAALGIMAVRWLRSQRKVEVTTPA